MKQSINKMINYSMYFSSTKLHCTEWQESLQHHILEQPTVCKSLSTMIIILAQTNTITVAVMPLFTAQ